MATGQAVSYGLSNPFPSIPHVSEIPYVGKFAKKYLSAPVGKTMTIFYLDVDDERYFFESKNSGMFVSILPVSATKYTIHTRHNVTKAEVQKYIEGRSLALSLSALFDKEFSISGSMWYHDRDDEANSGFPATYGDGFTLDAGYSIATSLTSFLGTGDKGLDEMRRRGHPELHISRLLS